MKRDPKQLKVFDQATERYSVPNLTRALRIMELLAESPRGLGISDIAETLHLPKNSVFRILATLNICGYVDRDDLSKTSRLSSKLLSLGYAAVADTSLVERSADILRQLRDLVGETVLLGTLTRDGGVVLDEVPSEYPVKVQVGIGTRFPLHSAAPAKAMLAFLPADERDRLIERCGFHRFTPHTTTDSGAFRAELNRVVESGYAVDAGEEIEGVACVGAPIFNCQNRPVAAVWVTGPESRLRTADFKRVGPQVASLAARISERMGCRSPGRVKNNET